MDEQELFAKYRETGDKALRDEIVSRYLYVAAVIAKKFVGRGVEYDDLYQVAALALVKGLERFDERRGVKFSTFITPTITGEIKNYFRDHSRLVHLPRSVSELRSEIKRATEALFAQNGRKPTAQEIAGFLGISEEDVVSAAEAGTVLSLDRPTKSADGEGSFYDVMAADGDDFERIEQRDEVRSAVKALNEQERELVRLRFGCSLSQTETAKRMGVSQMYVCRLERKIMQKMRAVLAKEGE